MTDTAQPREKPCYDCGKPIYLALMEESGRWWPVNPEPSPDGWVILAVNSETGMVKGRAIHRDDRKRLREEDPDLMAHARVPHFVTCQGPKAIERRRKFMEGKKSRRG